MRNQIIFPSLLSLLVLFFFSCEGPAPSSQGQAAENEITTEDNTPAVQAPTCAVTGEMVEGNEYWNSELNVLVRIKADSSTYAEGFGLSHRILEILNGEDCTQLFQQTLDENQSPDFPYHLADIQYNKVHNIVGIQGFYDLYICNLSNNKITPLKPSFFSEREYDDPQSGMIVHLEVWEDYLLGFAQDSGPFAFDLSDPANAQPILPFAEWLDADTERYHSLFLMSEEGTNKSQAIMPYYDYDEGSFVVTPLFNEAVALSTNVPKNARNNRFLVLRGEGDASEVYPIDLSAREVANLPADVLGKNTQEILKFMEAERGE